MRRFTNICLILLLFSFCSFFLCIFSGISRAEANAKNHAKSTTIPHAITIERGNKTNKAQDDGRTKTIKFCEYIPKMVLNTQERSRNDKNLLYRSKWSKHVNNKRMYNRTLLVLNGGGNGRPPWEQFSVFGIVGKVRKSTTTGKPELVTLPSMLKSLSGGRILLPRQGGEADLSLDPSKTARHNTTKAKGAIRTWVNKERSDDANGSENSGMFILGILYVFFSISSIYIQSNVSSLCLFL